MAGWRAVVIGLVGIVGCGAPSAVPVLVEPPPRPVAPPAPIASAPPAPSAPPAADEGPTGGKRGARAPLRGAELAKVRDHVAIVHVFASWCAPCSRSLPALQKVHAKYKGEIVVVGLAVDEDESDARDFARAHGVGFPVAWDADKSLATAWQVETMPTTYVVDRAGIVRHVLHGGSAIDVDAAERAAEALR